LQAEKLNDLAKTIEFKDNQPIIELFDRSIVNNLKENDCLNRFSQGNPKFIAINNE
jgi:hypothetical protein